MPKGSARPPRPPLRKAPRAPQRQKPEESGQPRGQVQRAPSSGVWPGGRGRGPCRWKGGSPPRKRSQLQTACWGQFFRPREGGYLERLASWKSLRTPHHGVCHSCLVCSRFRVSLCQQQLLASPSTGCGTARSPRDPQPKPASSCHCASAHAGVQGAM